MMQCDEPVTKNPNTGQMGFITHPPYEETSNMHKEHKRNIIVHLHTGIPMSIVENGGFRRFVNSINPRVLLTGWKTVRE